MASRCPRTDLDLLVGVLKPIAQIASFYAVSRHPDAVDERKSFGPTETFYEKLHMELDGFHTHLSGLGPAAEKNMLDLKEISENVSSILDVLDKTISNKLHEKYKCLNFKPSRHNLHAFFHLVKWTAAAESNASGISNDHIKPNAPIRSSTGIRSSASTKPNAYAKSNASTRPNILVTSNATTNSNAPAKPNARAKSNPLIRPHAAIRSRAAVKSSAPVRPSAPVKWKVPDFTNYINLRVEPKRRRDRLIAHLKEMNEAFTAGPLNHFGKAAVTLVIADLDQSETSLHQVPFTIRDQAERIYGLLTEHWKCQHKPHTAVKLRLYTYRKLGKKIRFEIFFAGPKDQEAQNEWWQESIVLARLDERLPWKPLSAVLPGYDANLGSDTKPLVDTEVQEAHPKDKSMSVRMRLPEIEEESRESGDESVESGDAQDFACETSEPGDEESKPPNGICRLIQMHADIGPQRLRLGVNKNGLHYYYPKKITQDVNRSVTLEDLIVEGDPCYMREIKKQPKAMLQVILANALLQFTGSSWVPPIWNKKHICFFLPADADIPDLSRPYYSTQCCNSPSDGATNSIQDATRNSSEKGTTKEVKQMSIGHPCPSLLALGFILLEIELGQSIESWRPKHTNQRKLNNNNHHYHIDADRPAAERMLEECYQDSHNSFSQAVRACIYDDSFTDEFKRDQDLSDSRFRQAVFEKVVLKLEDALKTVWDGSTEKLDKFCFAIKSANRSQKRLTQRRYDFSVGRKSTQKKGDKDPPIVGLKQVGGDQYTASAKSGADKWFTDLCALVHKPLGLLSEEDSEETSQPEVKERPFCHEMTEKIFGEKRMGPIRVGILDTGLELSDSAIAALDPDEKRVKGCWSFFDENGKPELIKEFKDSDGHGTHGATLILKVAPQAELFVARVFDTKQESTSGVEASDIHERIARAIRYAVGEWKVDVISMSFGFRSSIAIIEEAINEASRNDVIMIAAPANWGGQDKAAWPARHEQVIDIYATDHFANRCDFTPTPPKNSEGFATLGYAVESHWPESLNEGILKRKSGTSVATAIAAGLTALVLGYMKKLINDIGDKIDDDDVNIFKQIRTAAGMKAVFHHMVIQERDGYCFLGPWHYIGSGRAVFREEQTMIPFTFLRDMLLKN